MTNLEINIRRPKKQNTKINIKRLSLIVRVDVVLNRTVVVDSDWRFDNLCGSHLQSQSELYHVSWWYYTLVIDLIGQLRRNVNWRDTTHFDPEDDHRTGCRNVSHCQQQQSYSGLRSPGRSNSTFWYDSWVQTFHKKKLIITFLSATTGIFVGYAPSEFLHSFVAVGGMINR